jgi:2-oxo-hept-3-ene-1,7-dioate hydratase
MLTPDQIAEVAARHERARQQGRQIRRITLDYPDMDIADAYACQRAWVDQQIADGASVGGHKIGLTSRAMQSAMKIDEPDFGTLLDYMFFDNGAVLDASQFCDIRLEVELAFVLSAPLSGADVTREDVLAATERVIPSIELIDARSHRVDPDDGVSRTVFDTISDNAANAGIITGGNPINPVVTDLRWVSAILKRNGVVEETGVAAGVLDDPVMGIVWLAQRFAQFGQGLEAGQTILAGSFTRPVICRPGDKFEIDFGPHGIITCSFT